MGIGRLRPLQSAIHSPVALAIAISAAKSRWRRRRRSRGRSCMALHWCGPVVPRHGHRSRSSRRNSALGGRLDGCVGHPPRGARCEVVEHLAALGRGAHRGGVEHFAAHDLDAERGERRIVSTAEGNETVSFRAELGDEVTSLRIMRDRMPSERHAGVRCRWTRWCPSWLRKVASGLDRGKRNDSPRPGSPDSSHLGSSPWPFKSLAHREDRVVMPWNAERRSMRIGASNDG